MSANGTRTGVVKIFNDDRGFGFIRQDDDGGEVFFHVNQLIGDEEPKVRDRVSFVIGKDRDGRPCAQQVKIIE